MDGFVRHTEALDEIDDAGHETLRPAHEDVAVVEVGDNFLTLEVADGVRVKVQKFQVASLMPKGTLKSA